MALKIANSEVKWSRSADAEWDNSKLFDVGFYPSGRTRVPYSAHFPKGTKVRIASRAFQDRRIKPAVPGNSSF
jgi:hypothetical protein